MSTVGALIDQLAMYYSYLIIAYVILSWIPNARESVVGVFLGKLVEPFLTPFRKLIPPIAGMIDISPIVAYFALRFLALGIRTVLEQLEGIVT